MTNQNETTITKVTNTFLKAKEAIFAISVIVVGFLNLWLTSKLIPLDERIRTNSFAIAANTTTITECAKRTELEQQTISKQLEYIRERVDSIVDKHYTP